MACRVQPARGNHSPIIHQEIMIQQTFGSASSSLRQLGGALVLAFSAAAAMATETGRVGFETQLGVGVTTFQSGQKVYLGLKDVDRNLDAVAVDRVNVLVTSGTEDTGTRAKAEDIKAGANQGNGALSVLKTGYDTKTETWTVTCLGVNPPEFKVVG